MSGFDQFSVRCLSIDSALRQAKFVSEESRAILLMLEEARTASESESGRKLKEAKQRTIRFFRSIQRLLLDYSNLRNTFEQKYEDMLQKLLEGIRKESSAYLSKVKRGLTAWDVESVEPILQKITRLDHLVERVLTRLEKRKPAEGIVLYGGVDAGGTHSKAVVESSDGKKAEAVAGPCEFGRLGYYPSFAHILIALKEATKKIGYEFNLSRFRRICIGSAGVDRMIDHRKITALARQYISKKAPNIEDIIVIQDSLLAWYSAFWGKPGIVVIGGTGDFVYGYNPANKKEGASTMKGIYKDFRKIAAISGASLGINAARELNKLPKNKESILLRLWKEAYKNKKIFSRVSNQLTFSQALDEIGKLSFSGQGQIKYDEIAASAPLVTEAAEAGDPLALKLTTEASLTTAGYIHDVAKKIGLSGQEFPVSLVGSVIRLDRLLNLFKKRLKEKDLIRNLQPLEPGADIRLPEMEPTEGALQVAKDEKARFY